MQKHPIWGNEMTLPCFFGGIFYHINQNAKKKPWTTLYMGKQNSII